MKTPREMYDHLYKIHYKFLTQNHMSSDRSERMATIHAVKYTWSAYNRQKKRPK